MPGDPTIDDGIGVVHARRTIEVSASGHPMPGSRPVGRLPASPAREDDWIDVLQFRAHRDIRASCTNVD